MRLYQKALLVAAGVVVFQSGAMETGHTLPLPRTNVAPAYSQTCDTATVTLMSDWAGGTIHATIHGPSPAVNVDVPPNGFADATFKIVPSPLKVMITSSNGHITGTNTHTFTVSPCPTTPTTVPVATTAAVCPPGSHPDGPVSPCAWDVPISTPGGLNTPVVEPAPPVTMANPPNPPELPTTVTATTPPPTVPRPLQPGDRLAATGVGVDALLFIGFSLFFLGVLLVVTRRRTVKR